MLSLLGSQQLQPFVTGCSSCSMKRPVSQCWAVAGYGLGIQDIALSSNSHFPDSSCCCCTQSAFEAKIQAGKSLTAAYMKAAYMMHSYQKQRRDLFS